MYVYGKSIIIVCGWTSKQWKRDVYIWLHVLKSSESMSLSSHRLYEPCVVNYCLRHQNTIVWDTPKSYMDTHTHTTNGVQLSVNNLIYTVKFIHCQPKYIQCKHCWSYIYFKLKLVPVPIVFFLYFEINFISIYYFFFFCNKIKRTMKVFIIFFLSN